MNRGIERSSVVCQQEFALADGEREKTRESLEETKRDSGRVKTAFFNPAREQGLHFLSVRERE